MSKRLILLLALAFVVGLSLTAYAEVQNVKVSGDLQVIGATRALQLNQSTVISAGLKSRSNFLASIARVRIDADLTDNVMTTVRLLNERYWGGDSDNLAYDSGNEVDLDLGYATLKEFLYSPLTLTIGRQELHFGNDMIVGDPDTNNVANATSSVFGATTFRDPDLSARKAFDAIRATLNYDPLVINLIAAKVRERTLQRPDDENLYGIHANYAVNKTTTVEGYVFERQIEKGAFTKNKADTTIVPGARIVSKAVKDLTLQLEGAVQIGRDVISTTQAVPRKAWAVEAAATYDLKNYNRVAKYKPTASLLYAFFSGQKGDAFKRTTAWDPMYENQSYGNIANALFNQTNAHILGTILTAKPKDDITLKGEYYAFWWDKRYGQDQVITDVRGENVTMKHQKFAGSEIDLTATYDYTEDVQFNLLAGMFIPGAAFARSNRDVANEVIGSMKVTF